MVMRTYRRRRDRNSQSEDDCLENVWSSQDSERESQPVDFIHHTDPVANPSSPPPRKLKKPTTHEPCSFYSCDDVEMEFSTDRSLSSAHCHVSASLLEAQESGELAELLDEATFSMDGLRAGQPLRVLQASMTAMAVLCRTVDIRRVLRTNGLVTRLLKTILSLQSAMADRVVALAALSILYLMAIDGQDAAILQSADCIAFIAHFLALPTHSKGSPDGSMADAALLLSENKVKSLFLGKSGAAASEPLAAVTEEDLNPRGLALLTLEISCGPLLFAAGDCTAGATPQVPGAFRDAMRENGAIQSVCQLASDCIQDLELSVVGDVANSASASLALERCSVLLRCLRVLELATFVNECNQKYVAEICASNSQKQFVAALLDGISQLTAIESSTNRINLQPPEMTPEPKKRPDTWQAPRLGQDIANIIGSRSMSRLQGSKAKQGQCPAGKWPPERGMRRKSPAVMLGDPVVGPGRLQGQLADSECSGRVSEEGRGKIHGCQKRPSIYLKLKSKVIECLGSAMKVLMNLTNENPAGCQLVVSSGGIRTIAELAASRRSPPESRPPAGTELDDGEDDLLMVALGVMVNLVEKDDENRHELAGLTFSGTSGTGTNNDIVSFLCSLVGSKDSVGNSTELAFQELGRGDVDGGEVALCEKEAAGMMVESYATLLLGFLAFESGTKLRIAQQLEPKSIDCLVPILEDFLEFHRSLNTISKESAAMVQLLIKNFV